MVTTAMPCLLVWLSVASVGREGAATCLAPATHPTGILTGLLWCAPASSASRVSGRKTRELGLRVRAHVDRRPSYVLGAANEKSPSPTHRAPLGTPRQPRVPEAQRPRAADGPDEPDGPDPPENRATSHGAAGRLALL